MKTTLDYKLPCSLFLYGMLPFVLALCAIVGQIIAPSFGQQGLDLIGAFLPYALLSQFTHLSWMHLGLNLAGLGMMTWGFSTWCTPQQQAISLLWGWLWVALYITTLEPLLWYCGLSGVLHASFTCQWTWAWKKRPPQHTWPLILLGLGLILKLCLEWLNNGPVFDPNIGGPIAVEAHRGGAIGGFLLGILGVGIQRYRSHPPQQ